MNEQFDFEEYIIKNSSRTTRGGSSKVLVDIFDGKKPNIKCDEHNAKIICEIYKLAEKLK